MEVVDELIEKRIVKNLAQFCKKIDYPPQSMSQIKGGTRDVTIDLVSKLFSTFRGNPLYLLSGKGSRILDDQMISVVEDGLEQYIPQSADRSTFKHLEDIVQSKDKTIAVQDTLINTLQEKISELEYRLKNPQIK